LFYWKSGKKSGYGNGTVVLYTIRVTEAILSLHDEIIKWPTRNERKRTSRYCDERLKVV
jgi:hypothetical protein